MLRPWSWCGKGNLMVCIRLPPLRSCGPLVLGSAARTEGDGGGHVRYRPSSPSPSSLHHPPLGLPNLHFCYLGSLVSPAKGRNPKQFGAGVTQHLGSKAPTSVMVVSVPAHQLRLWPRILPLLPSCPSSWLYTIPSPLNSAKGASGLCSCCR